MIEAVRVIYEREKLAADLNSAQLEPIDRDFMSREQKERIRAVGQTVICTDEDISVTMVVNE